MRYTVFEWHKGSLVLYDNLTLEEVANLNYQYMMFDHTHGQAWVTNCCQFRTH